MAHIHELYDFTASAYILHPSEPKVCLHFHKKLHKWLQPGGHIELNEDPLEALEHELLEETGLKSGEWEVIELTDQPHPRNSKTIPMPLHIEVHSFNETHKHIDFGFLIKSRTEILKPQKGESVKIGWFTKSEIIELNKSGQLNDGTLDICAWILSNQTLSNQLHKPANFAVKESP